MAKLNNKSSVYLIFTEFSKNYPKQFLLLFLLLVIEGAAAAISMLSIVPMADYLVDTTLLKASRITKFVINYFLIFKIKPSFLSFGILFVVLNILKGILEVGVKYAILIIKYNVIHGLLDDALDKFFKSKWGFFSGSDNGMLLNTLSKELTIIGDGLGQIAMQFAQILQLFIFLTVPLILNFKLTLAILALSLLFALPFLFLNKLTYKLGKQNTETANVAMTILIELLQTAKLILGYGKQKYSKEKYLTALKKHIKITLQTQTLSTAIPKFFQPLSMLAVVLAIGFILNKNMPISEIAAVMWSFFAALPILATLLQGNINIKNFIPSYEQLVLLRNRAKEFQEIEGEIFFTKLQNHIEFKRLDFTYPGREKTLNNINLKIIKGKITALVGESGSGKSTITDLLLGLQIPNLGEILIDGINLNLYKQNSFRQLIGYVPQDPILFHCSIRDNLLWSNEKATQEDMWDVLKLANADIFVNDLPEGIDTIVGDRGIRLSGGQRQRIALARALIRKPELLILDEATSSLDSESEKLIQFSIENVSKETTILVVAHRLSTIAKSNQVYVLNHGKIIEEGSFDSLSVKQNGILNQMLKSQIQ